MNYKLTPLWKELLKVYSTFREGYKKHNLRFFATIGTAIGAVRHNGLIPWYDDFDLMMPHGLYIDRFSVDDTPSSYAVHLRWLMRNYRLTHVKSSNVVKLSARTLKWKCWQLHASATGREAGAKPPESDARSMAAQLFVRGGEMTPVLC